MSSEHSPATGPEVAAAPRPDGAPARQPDWWHRDHPTFTAITGFFTGLAYVIIVPGLYVVVLSWLFDDATVEDLFPFVVVGAAVPVGLALVPRTRRFGLYMLIGVVATALVVAGVAALVLWILVDHESDAVVGLSRP